MLSFSFVTLVCWIAGFFFPAQTTATFPGLRGTYQIGFIENNQPGTGGTNPYMPEVIPADVQYFRNRISRYEMLGETQNKGVVRGYDGADNLRFEADYSRYALNGLCRSFHTNGNLRDSGMMQLNLPDGTWRFYYEDGTLKSIRNYNAYMWWAIQWSIEKQNPFWNKFAIADLYARSRSAFFNTVNGVSTFDDAYLPLFEYCVHDGISINYYRNGQVADSGNYFQGLKDGFWKQYHENGKIKSKGAYQSGEKIGTWTYEDTAGEIIRIETIKRGKITSVKTF